MTTFNQPQQLTLIVPINPTIEKKTTHINNAVLDLRAFFSETRTQNEYWLKHYDVVELALTMSELAKELHERFGDTDLDLTARASAASGYIELMIMTNQVRDMTNEIPNKDRDLAIKLDNIAALFTHVRLASDVQKQASEI